MPITVSTKCFRYSRYDKAFLLAVDINARDLFMDIYYAALDSGQQRLAAAAKHKAKQCEDELMFSGKLVRFHCHSQQDNAAPQTLTQTLTEIIGHFHWSY